jgi:bleomycin hydrolase
MAIVGIAHDEEGGKYFIMKNSWGTDGPYKGLEYVSFDDFKDQTRTLVMTKEAYCSPAGEQ